MMRGSKRIGRRTMTLIRRLAQHEGLTLNLSKGAALGDTHAVTKNFAAASISLFTEPSSLDIP